MSDTAAKALRFAIAGIAGRMGRTFAAAALARGIAIAGGTEQDGHPALEADIGQLAGHGPIGIKPSASVGEAAAGATTWIDFTRPAATLAALDQLAGTPVQSIIIGTTGFTAKEESRIAAASQHFAIVKAGNFSIGINLLESLAERAARALGQDWDIEILETHHRHKADAPSGTALMMGEAVSRGLEQPLEGLRQPPYDGPEALRAPGRIGFAVRRAGGVTGEHEVLFGSEQELIRLSHTALDRSVFAEGALRAAAWASGQPPGLYSMRDVLEIDHTG